MTNAEKRAYNDRLNEHIVYGGYDYLTREETAELKRNINDYAKHSGHIKIGNGKASYYKGKKGITLRSYWTDVCRINRGRFYKTWEGYSATTLNHILERGAEDLPLMIPHEDGHEFLTDMDIDIYIDAVLID